MDNSQLPDRHRWDGWVTFAWLMVALAVMIGLVMIGAGGTVAVPETNYRGNITWTEQTNYIVWGAVIGQVVGAAMLAAIFSIINSNYQNSCDMLRIAAGPAPAPSTSTKSRSTPSPTSNQTKETATNVMPEKVAPHGAVVYEIRSTSPFYRLLQPGYSIVSVNGVKVENEPELKEAAKKGKNKIEFSDEDGKEYSITINFNPEDFGVTFWAGK